MVLFITYHSINRYLSNFMFDNLFYSKIKFLLCKIKMWLNNWSLIPIHFGKQNNSHPQVFLVISFAINLFAARQANKFISGNNNKIYKKKKLPGRISKFLQWFWSILEDSTGSF